MRMTDRDRQGIGGVGLRCLAQIEQDFHHVLNLCLRGVAAADQRLLDLIGAIFLQRQRLHAAGHDCNASCLAQLDRRIGILVHENTFDSRLGRGLPINEFTQFAEYLTQALGIIRVTELDGAVGNVTQMITLTFYNAVTGNAGAWIDAEDSNHRSGRRSGQLREYFIGDIGVGINLLNVVQVLKHLE